MQQVSGWAEQGGSVVVIPGTQGSGVQRFQQSFRAATVTVRDSSNNLATIYSDDLASPTAKANPFTASSTTGAWNFYTTTGTYTLTFSGGSILAPFSITVNVGLGNAGGVPSYAFASLPTSKTQNAGDIARVTDSLRGLWMDTGAQWAKQFPPINVKDFGATGDGTTNDRAALLLADAIGTTLVFPKGTYKITTGLTLTSPLVFLNGAVTTLTANETYVFTGQIRSDNTFAATFPNAKYEIDAGFPTVTMPTTGVSTFTNQVWIGTNFTMVADSSSPSDSAVRDNVTGYGFYQPGSINSAPIFSVIVGGVEAMRFNPSGVAGTPGVLSIGDGDEIITDAQSGEIVFHYNRGIRSENNARTTTYALINGGSWGNKTGVVKIGGGDSAGTTGQGPIALGTPAASGLTDSASDDAVLRYGKYLRSTDAAGTSADHVVGQGTWGGASNVVKVGGGDSHGSTGPGPIIVGAPTTTGLSADVSADDLVIKNGNVFRSITAAGTACGPLISSDANDLTGVSSAWTTIANNGTDTICANTKAGMLFVTDDAALGFGASGQFELLGTGGAAREVSDPEGLYSIAAGTAGKTNIYYSAPNYIIQNLTGGSMRYKLVLIGY